MSTQVKHEIELGEWPIGGSVRPIFANVSVTRGGTIPMDYRWAQILTETIDESAKSTLGWDDVTLVAYFKSSPMPSFVRGGEPTPGGQVVVGTFRGIVAPSKHTLAIVDLQIARSYRRGSPQSDHNLQSLMATVMCLLVNIGPFQHAPQVEANTIISPAWDPSYGYASHSRPNPDGTSDWRDFLIQFGFAESGAFFRRSLDRSTEQTQDESVEAPTDSPVATP